MRVLVGGRGVLCCKIQFLYYFREGNASSEECDELNIKVNTTRYVSENVWKTICDKYTPNYSVSLEFKSNFYS